MYVASLKVVQKVALEKKGVTLRLENGAGVRWIGSQPLN